MMVQHDEEKAVASARGNEPHMKLNIVLMSMGSRGDIQPHLEIAKALQRRYGHRVRIVCSEKYQAMVEADGVEFYSWGDCDPYEVMRRRLLPFKEVKKTVPDTLREYGLMNNRYWGACIGDSDGIPEGDTSAPFLADAVLAIMSTNAHSWIASRMGIPLHMIGTNPRSPTKTIPHCQMTAWAGSESVFKNVISWWLWEYFVAQNFKGVHNRFREGRLGLEPFSPVWFMSQWNRLRVPFTNIWSPVAFPKPIDWGAHLDIASFVFHESPNYEPPTALVDFLEVGERPIYVGFGSMPILNPDKVFQDIIDGISKTGVRAILSRGWSGLDQQIGVGVPDIYIVDECPHHWLFPRVAAVVIHGGAGTIAMALKTGRPTVVYPVAGDQAFWADRIFKLGCGPKGIPIKDLTTENFHAQIQEVLKPEYATNAAMVAAKIAQEEPGAEVFARRAQETFSIYETEGRCDIMFDRTAVWKCTANNAKLSALAAHVLVQQGALKQSQLRPLQIIKMPDLASPGDPIGGFVVGVFQVLHNIKHDVTEKHFLLLPLHILQAPIIMLHFILFGLYSLIDFIAYELGSQTDHDLFASNPWNFSLSEMLSLLCLKPFKELGSISRRPAQSPLAIIRFIIGLLNILIGIIALPLRAFDIKISTALGDRPKVDVVAEGRIKHGRKEAEYIGQQDANAAVQLTTSVVEAWGQISKTAPH